MKDLSLLVGDVKFNYRAGLLIEKGNKVLVECNPKYDFVTLPGGRVQTLESTYDTLIREIKEEMNVDLITSELTLKAFIENFFEMEDTKYHELYLLYKYKVNLKNNIFEKVDKNIDSTASYYKWVCKDELEEVNLLPKVLREAVKTDKFENIVIKDI